MSIFEYLMASKRTVPANDPNPVLHAAMGLCTESAELLDALKKNMFYGKELDVVNLEEELGDLMWYMAYLLRELDLDFSRILQNNIDKLMIRYPEKFDQAKALDRDLDSERKELEKS
jgi:NTP pyrophosphatase (non-canonical NTP hydrolase)